MPGEAIADPVTKIYSSGNLTTPIDDSSFSGGGMVLHSGLTVSKITVPDEGRIVGVKLRLRMSHTVDTGWLTFIDLDTPDRPGGGEGLTYAVISSRLADFGSGSTDCAGSPATLDDSASTPIETSSPPFVGSYRPETPLADLAGIPITGDWEIMLLDSTPGGSGTLYCWELEVTYEPPSTDLTLVVKDSPDPVKVGKRLSYTITAANAGPAPASGVVVTDTLPAGAAFVGAASPDARCTRAGRKVTCYVGDLPVGESARVTVRVKAPKKPGRLVNVTRVTSHQFTEDTVSTSTRVRRR